MTTRLARLGCGLSVAALIAILSVAAVATPVPGLYFSPSIGNDIIVGRASEAWNAGGAGLAGNTILAQSWDGISLGTQWEIRDPVSLGAVFRSDSRVAGTGQVVYHTDYSGGTFYINNAAWGSGSGNITSYSHDTTITYYKNVVVGIRNNVNATGVFTSDPLYVMDFAVANSVEVGKGANVPPGYPGFIGSPAALQGEWSNVHDIAIQISMVPEPGGILALSSGLVGLVGTISRRRRR